MTAVITAALIAGGFAALGWPALYVTGRRTANDNVRREAALRHLERQLGELYGPITFYILEGQHVFDELAADYGSAWLEGNRKLTGDELERWIFWVDEYFLPRNERIQ